ncbi:MAG: T9SS type A sorting domain-containing protein [Flavobacteriales bacterium]|nr:T9SS type A sorting domain-containing protein [Flavobacteriales bacterium]
MMKRYASFFMLAVLVGQGVWAQCPGTTVTVFSSDFEANNGGLVSAGFGDWQWGATPNLLLNVTCTSTHTDPPGPYSGANGWATILNDCYSNSGATSTLGLTVDLSDPTYVAAELNLAQWWEYFTNFDYGDIFVNGINVYHNDTTGLSPAWQQMTIDLTPYVGQSSVLIEFSLFATAVVNKAGWYLDDISVTACAVGNVAVPEAATPLAITTYPNPTSDVITVGTKLTGAVTFILSDATGRSVLLVTQQAVNDQVQLDLSGIAPGTYTLTGIGDNGRAVSRIVRR